MDREAKIALAKELREQGCTYQAIADRLNIGRETARRWTDPEAKEKALENDRKYRQSENGRDKRREYNRSEKAREYQRKRNQEYQRKYPRKYEYTDKDRENRRNSRQSTSHPETTYFIGSPDCNRVVIGKTINWNKRIYSAYTKSLVPLRLLGMTRIPELNIHDKFRHLQVPGYSREVFHLTPELEQFINDYCWQQIFRYSECFVGQDDTQPEVATEQV